MVQIAGAIVRLTIEMVEGIAREFDAVDESGAGEARLLAFHCSLEGEHFAYRLIDIATPAISATTRGDRPRRGRGRRGWRRDRGLRWADADAAHIALVRADQVSTVWPDKVWRPP